jgi:hypothetical protein
VPVNTLNYCNLLHLLARDLTSGIALAPSILCNGSHTVCTKLDGFITKDSDSNSNSETGNCTLMNEIII